MERPGVLDGLEQSSVQFGWKTLEDANGNKAIFVVFFVWECGEKPGTTMAQKIKAWQNSCWTYVDQTNM